MNKYYDIELYICFILIAFMIANGILNHSTVITITLGWLGIFVANKNIIYRMTR